MPVLQQSRDHFVLVAVGGLSFPSYEVTYKDRYKFPKGLSDRAELFEDSGGSFYALVVPSPYSLRTLSSDMWERPSCTQLGQEGSHV